MTKESLGLSRLEALHFYVHDLARSRRFYTGRFDFAETAVSSPGLERAGRQRSAVFEAGGVRVVCSEPAGEGGRAWRWLRQHPDGVGALIFEVGDARRAFALLEERGGTPISEVETVRDGAGALHTFSITTPFGGTTFRFVQREGFASLYPGMAPHPAPRGGANAFGFAGLDHVTAAFETMAPALLWMEHVLGFERCRGEELDAGAARAAARRAPSSRGPALRSAVMRDPASGVTFALEEPRRPAFKSSLVNVFHEDQRGDGIQHAALALADLLPAVRGLRGRGVRFMAAPAAYHAQLEERLRRAGVGPIDERVEELREAGVLVDGSAPGAYLLQIFLQDSAELYGEPAAGPFFFELLQRKGDQGFGAGNHEALLQAALSGGG